MLKISTIICQNCNKKRVKFKLDSLFVRHHKSTSMAKPPRKTKVFGLCPSGGAEGNRTPVRKQLGRNFSGCSLLFTFPHPGGNKHPTGFSSFIMHGTRKALRTHGLHSDHTLARLVDLPGRMGA